MKFRLRDISFFPLRNIDRNMEDFSQGKTWPWLWFRKINLSAWIRRIETNIRGVYICRRFDPQGWCAGNAHLFTFFRLSFQFCSAGLIGNSVSAFVSCLLKDAPESGKITMYPVGPGRTPDLHSIMVTLTSLKTGSLYWLKSMQSFVISGTLVAQGPGSLKTPDSDPL